MDASAFMSKMTSAKSFIKWGNIKEKQVRTNQCVAGFGGDDKHNTVLFKI